MDIWEWVERARQEAEDAGNLRLATLIERIPYYVTDDEHAQLDAVFPEALALAREAKKPWLEVFFRHWNLQSRILHRVQVSEWIGEAVHLLEFAHREETKGCPQSVCATQDLANCYGHMDGPGYVPERLAVAAETLDRINPRWPCFICISTEYAQALVDGGRPEDALAYCEAQEAALVSEGVPRDRRGFASSRSDALIALGQWQEALELVDVALETATNDHERTEYSIQKARALAGLGRLDEARQVLPSYEAIEPTAVFYGRWVPAVAVLARGGTVPNDWNLERSLLRLEDRLVRNGSIRAAFDIARERAQLAALRKQPLSVQHAVERMEALLPKLRQPISAPGELARAREALRDLGTPAPELPAEPQALLDTLSDDPEADLPRLLAARARWPEAEQLTLTASRALEALGRMAEAMALLRGQLERAPDSRDTLQHLAMLLLDEGKLDELRRLANDVLARATTDESRSWPHVFLARAAGTEGKFDEAKEHLRQSVALDPEQFGTTMELAQVQRVSGDLEGALNTLNAAVERWPKPGPHDWERMIAATLLDRWEELRHSAKRLEFELEGEGPVEFRGELCGLRLEEEDGEVSQVLAQRTGPVMARVLSIAVPDKPQHCGDEFVFRPTPVNDGPQEGEDEDKHVWIYPAIAVKRPGNRVVFGLEGVHPGEEAVNALRGALVQCRAQLVVMSNEKYVLTSPEDEEVLGIFARVAVPQDVELAQIEQALSTAAEGWEHPVVWPELLERMERPEEAAAHREVMERYGIQA